MGKEYKCWIFIYITVLANVYTLVRSGPLPQVIYDLCPYSDICNSTASGTLNIEGMVPCCSSCSCDEDCGLHLNCCFDYLDKYKLVEKGKAACIEPIVRYTQDGKHINVRYGYYMVQTCDNDTFDAAGKSYRCRLTDEQGYSLISPVSSPVTNLIYINKECAKCNKLNTAQLQQWNYLFQSDIVSLESTVTFDIENNVGNRLGTLVYVPPRAGDWSDKHCHNNYAEVNSCLDNDDWQSFCYDLQATFLTSVRTTFKNGFCSLCSGKHVEKIPKICQSAILSRSTGAKLTALLDVAVVEASKLSDMSTTVSASTTSCTSMYIESEQKMCLAINCPEGMLNTRNGCIHFALKWYVPYLAMQIKLHPQSGRRLPVSKLRLYKAQIRTQPFKWLKVPCRKLRLTGIEVHYSTIEPVLYQTDRENATKEYVSSLIVRIWKMVDTNRGVTPSVVIPLFFKCVSETWLAKLENETYKFDANFDKYIWYVQDGRQILRKWPENKLLIPAEDNARPALYTPLVKGPNLGIGGIALKKPFFCNQVRVPLSDVDINFGEIRIISKNISFGTNEYIVNKPNVYGDAQQSSWNRTTVSVCVNDYDPTFKTVSESKACVKSLSATFICVFLSRHF